ncbi:hypothetical protein [Ancylobacter lacus]|uniref:hypothetical protein n=1 Tax=Ancylobacter lacus TaxID=2579970 RepID=UPI001BCF62FE|nr:hypothetical protein [Ancylobacter lacus]MBS7538400.1 hypothetical protein [Ancylobacter lacus]
MTATREHVEALALRTFEADKRTGLHPDNRFWDAASVDAPMSQPPEFLNAEDRERYRRKARDELGAPAAPRA